MRKDIAFDCFVSICFFRCGQLESALNEATSRVRTLENKNNLLEREVVSMVFLVVVLVAKCLKM